MPPDMTDLQISPHFTWHELTRTDHADLQEANRIVPAPMTISANALAWGILEPIRRHFGQPLVVHSAYRCQKLNERVGGSVTSQHMAFKAADFHMIGVSNSDVWEWVAKSGLPFGQLIHEPSWIHVSLGWPLYEKHKSGRVMTFDGSNYDLIDHIPPG